MYIKDIMHVRTMSRAQVTDDSGQGMGGRKLDSKNDFSVDRKKSSSPSIAQADDYMICVCFLEKNKIKGASKVLIIPTSERQNFKK